MSTDLITGQATAVANIPAYAQGDSGLGDLGGDSFPRLTFKGARFRVKKGDDEQVLNDLTLDVIILAANPTVSRVYYEGAYDPDATGARPSCASADGEVPLATVAQPQSTACQSCPMNEKGSQISDDGGKRKACGYFHRLVIRMPKYPDLGEVVTEVKALSLFGPSFPDQNLLNFRMYADRLNSHQTMAHAVITQMSFDTNSSVPKVLFQPIGYVTEADFNGVYHPLATSQAIIDMADTSTMRTGADAGGAVPATAFREQLIAGAEAPALAGPIAPAQPAAPVLSPAEQQIADLQAQIAALAAPPEPVVPVETPAEKQQRELQEQIAALTAKMQGIAPSLPAAGAAESAAVAVAAQPAAPVVGVTAGAAAFTNVHGVAWNPEFHATSKEGQPVTNTDGHYKAKRGISAELKAKVKMPQGGVAQPVAPAAAAIAPVVAQAVAPVPAPVAATPQVEGADFDANLDAALAEFDA